MRPDTAFSHIGFKTTARSPGGLDPVLKELVFLFHEDTTTESKLGRALEVLGRGLEKDRVLLIPSIRIQSDHGQTEQLEWSRFDSAEPSHEAGAETGYPAEWRVRLEAGETVLIVNAALADAREAGFTARGVRSMLLAPIFVNGTRWGHLRVDDRRSGYAWDKTVIDTLETAAGLLAIELEISELKARSNIEHAGDLEMRLMTGTIATELEEIRRLKETVFSSFAHDFQTPLYTLLGFSATLLENEELDRDPEIRRMCLRHIHEQAHRLEGLVKDILFISDGRRSDEEDAWERVDLIAIISEAAEHCRVRGEAKGVDVISDIADSTFIASCRPQRIIRAVEDVFSWSLGNTIKGGWICISARSGDDSLALTISDNGIGFPESMTESLFEPFSCSRPAGRTSSRGMGLCIAKDIVDLHGGFITVESKEGDGAVVRITLPSGPASR